MSLEKCELERRRWVGMGLTVLPGTNLYVGKKFGKVGSHCITRGGAREEAGPTVPLGRNCEVGKTFHRNGSHCVPRDELAGGEEDGQGWVQLYH